MSVCRRGWGDSTEHRAPAVIGACGLVAELSSCLLLSNKPPQSSNGLKATLIISHSSVSGVDLVGGPP